MNKVLVIGSNGMLGYAVSEYYKRNFFQVVELCRKDFDIAKDPMSKFEKFLDDVDIVINCAGVIKPRIAVNSIEDVLRINSIFPRNLAKLCGRRKIKCFHITTDCIYSGKKGKYTEDEYCDAEDLYGLSKAAGDTKECMTLRTSIIGEEKNQSRSMFEWARSQAGKEVNGFTNHYWNGVTTVYLAEIIKTILEKDLYQNGIFNIYSPNTIKKYKLLQIFNEVYELNLKINPVEADTFCNRSLSTVYKLSSEVVQKTIEHQVKEMRNFSIKKRFRR
ncbi:MAG: sugar nucleotide-binding protein [Candidatus Marinimicrobia bacterium]|nr:sugar nucleotide-binding protein [Candidatus Neomarinimicrobiota bacterium]